MVKRSVPKTFPTVYSNRDTKIDTKNHPLSAVKSVLNIIFNKFIFEYYFIYRWTTGDTVDLNLSSLSNLRFILFIG